MEKLANDNNVVPDDDPHPGCFFWTSKNETKNTFSVEEKDVNMDTERQHEEDSRPGCSFWPIENNEECVSLAPDKDVNIHFEQGHKEEDEENPHPSCSFWTPGYNEERVSSVGEEHDENMDTEREHAKEEDVEEDNNYELHIGGTLDVDRIQEDTIEDRQIGDMGHILREIHRIFDDHCPALECPLRDLVLVDCRQNGLKTKFVMQCRRCNFKESLWSEPMDGNRVDIDTSAWVQ